MTATDPAVPQRGHPPGLYMLFFAEMWERFCFYGMRALLVLYMVKGFLGYGDADAGYVYSSYNALVYLTPILGGILADKLLGYRAAIILGGIVMALGEFTLLIEQEFAFYAGMSLIILGNGLFKPNISTLVGRLYPPGDPRRDSGFTIFYMGINIGALTSTLVCGWIGETYGWTWGFGLAGLGMLAGIFTFAKGKRLLEGHGEPPNPAVFNGNLTKVIGGLAVVAPLVYLLLQNEAWVTTLLLAGIGTTMIGIFTVALRSDQQQREKLFLLMILWVFHALFWAFFEQAGSSLTLFTDRNVDKVIGGWDMPTTWGQFFNPAFIVIFGAVFSLMWTKLGERGRDPSIPGKFGLALIQLGAGYGVLVLGATFGAGGMVPLIFLVLCYLLHTTGELCLSPVGLSAVTKLAPPKIVGMVMGAWFLSISAGHKIAGFVNALTGAKPEFKIALGVFDSMKDKDPQPENAVERASMMAEMVTKECDGNTELEATVSELLRLPESDVARQTLDVYLGIYNNLCWIAVGAGLLLLVSSPVLKRWQHGVK